jgi:hypothetical protein
MIEFKLYGKTKPLIQDIKFLAIKIGGFAKYNETWRIVLTNAKATKQRRNIIENFCVENNLKCFQEKIDGADYAQKHLGSFGSFLK